MSTDETWYQAVLQLIEHDGGHTDYTALGPPRRLIEDIKIDINREGDVAIKRFADNPIWETGILGAIVLWPSDRHQDFLSEKQLHELGRMAA